MNKWEYDQVICAAADAKAMLAEMGQQGWELCFAPSPHG